MKLTKKQIQTLECILSDLERAKSFVMKDDIAIVGKYKHGSTILHFPMPDGKYGVELCKEIGSDLTGLCNGLTSLGKFLESEKQKKA